MKKTPKLKITPEQFDRALLDQIEYSRNMNIPKNALSSCAMFGELVGKKLFGSRAPESRSAEFRESFNRVMREAKEERALEHTKEIEEARTEKSRIVLTGSN